MEIDRLLLLLIGVDLMGWRRVWVGMVNPWKEESKRVVLGLDEREEVRVVAMVAIGCGLCGFWIF